MKGQLIGEGNTAEVFTWGENEVLKLFRQEFPQNGIVREYNASEAVVKLGLPVPKVGELIDLEGRRGIIYERITGDSMFKMIMTKPFTAGKLARRLAELHYKIHQCKVKGQGFYQYKEAILWNINQIELLTVDQKAAVIKLLEQLPEGEALCHGDFHPGNVILVSEQPYILDWMTAMIGNPAADVARTILLLKDAALPESTPRLIGHIVNIMRNRLAKAYLKRYIQLSGLHKEDIIGWRIPLAAARLTEWVPESEKNVLLAEINKAISIGRN